MSKKREHIENSKEFKSLAVNAGVENPGSLNESSIDRFLKRNRALHDTEEYVDGILSGNITMLSKAITLVESSRPDHQKLAQKIIERTINKSGNSLRIGITGVPGVGKSTFIEALGSHITSLGGKLAVLAIDPSSERTKGSILGDKTRMERLSSDRFAYIRPSPSAGSLGGVARKTRETILLCEAAGFNYIFIETVGVGQSETAVHSMSDIFLLLMLAGAGDELQGIKRGIMEMADVMAINKADGNNIEKAKLVQMQYQNALNLFPGKESEWKPKVHICSAIEGGGIDEIWSSIEQFQQLTVANGYFQKHRNEQSTYWMHENIEEQLLNIFYRNEKLLPHIDELEQRVLKNEITPHTAADKLLEIYVQLK